MFYWGIDNFMCYICFCQGLGVTAKNRYKFVPSYFNFIIKDSFNENKMIYKK